MQGNQLRCRVGFYGTGLFVDKDMIEVLYNEEFMNTLVEDDRQVYEM